MKNILKIDGVYMFKAEQKEVENLLLKLSQLKKEFNIQITTSSPLVDLIPQNIDNRHKLKKLNLQVQIPEIEELLQVLYHEEEKRFTYLYTSQVELFLNTGLKLDFYQTHHLKPVYIVNKQNNETIGVIMPINTVTFLDTLLNKNMYNKSIRLQDQWTNVEIRTLN